MVATQGWEGEIEVRQQDRPSVHATAHLWRRNDASGVQWGGQLKLPADGAQLDAGACTITLPNGQESVAVISRGAQRDWFRYPTIVGMGWPPFGEEAGDEERLAPVPGHDEALDGPDDGPLGEALDEPDDALAQPHHEPDDGLGEPPGAHAHAGPHLISDHAAPPDAWDSPAGAPAGVAAKGEPEMTAESEGDHGGGAAMARALAPGGPPADGDRTESLARAFIYAAEARRLIVRFEAQGFEGSVLAGVIEIIDELAAFIESGLRGGEAATGEFPDWVQQRITLVRWFTAVTDDAPTLAEVSAQLYGLTHSLTAVASAREAA